MLMGLPSGPRSKSMAVFSLYFISLGNHPPAQITKADIGFTHKLNGPFPYELAHKGFLGNKVPGINTRHIGPCPDNVHGILLPLKHNRHFPGDCFVVFRNHIKPLLHTYNKHLQGAYNQAAFNLLGTLST